MPVLKTAEERAAAAEAALGALRAAGLHPPYDATPQTSYFDGRNTIRLWCVTSGPTSPLTKETITSYLLKFLHTFDEFEYQGVRYTIDLGDPAVVAAPAEPP